MPTLVDDGGDCDQADDAGGQQQDDEESDRADRDTAKIFEELGHHCSLQFSLSTRRCANRFHVYRIEPSEFINRASCVAPMRRRTHNTRGKPSAINVIADIIAKVLPPDRSAIGLGVGPEQMLEMTTTTRNMPNGMFRGYSPSVIDDSGSA